MRKGRFITFEGGDGAGKSTLIETVAAKLAAEGHRIVKTREPGGTHFGEHIRTLLLEHASGTPLSPYAELALFLAARAQHVQEVISPALKDQRIVLCDRFNDSTLAYQGAARGLLWDKVWECCLFFCQGVQPDLTLYLDIDPQTGLARAQREQLSQGGTEPLRSADRIESEGTAFHEKIRTAFRQIQEKDPERVCLIDAGDSPDAVAALAMKRIHQLLSS